MSVTPVEHAAQRRFGRPDANGAPARGRRSSQVAPRRTAVRTFAEAVATVLIVTALVRTWLLQAFTIDGGSMAPTLVAEHVDIPCPGCGTSFSAGVEGAASNGRRAICPQCGNAEGRIDTADASSGDTVLVDKTAFLWRRPRRWEVVSLRAPHDAAKVCAKRIAGLPGEDVSIVDGDVYINGRLAHKNLAEQRALGITVHDDRFRPAADRSLAGWQSGENSSWAINEHGFSYSKDSEGDSPRSHRDTEGMRKGRDDRDATPSLDERPSSKAQDWLTYHHLRLDNMGVPAESPVQDVYGYNQTLPIRELHVVRDLLLSFEIVAQGHGTLYLRGTDGVHDFLCSIGADRNVRLFCDDDAVATGTLSRPLSERPCSVEFSLIDRCCLLAVDGQVLIEHPFDPPPAAAPTTTRPFAIGCRDLTVDISALRITRDVYHGPLASGESPPPVRLGKDEYYVLSDNAPRGFDSRDRRFGPAVPFKLFVGKPLAASGAGRSWADGWPAIQVPALHQIRYIR